MNAVGTMQSRVKNSRNGSRRPPARSLSAPRIGETIALIPTLTAIATLNAKGRSPAELPVLDEPEAHRVRHDRVAEDRVREVVQRPADRDDRAPARRQAGEPAAPAAGWTAVVTPRGHGPAVTAP